MNKLQKQSSFQVKQPATNIALAVAVDRQVKENSSLSLVLPSSDAIQRPPLPIYQPDASNATGHAQARPQSKNEYREDVADMESPIGKQYDRD